MGRKLLVEWCNDGLYDTVAAQTYRTCAFNIELLCSSCWSISPPPSGFPIILKEPVKALFEQVTGTLEDYVYLPVGQKCKCACSCMSVLCFFFFSSEEGWLLKMIYVSASPARDLQFYNYISELNQFFIFAFTLTRSLLKWCTRHYLGRWVKPHLLLRELTNWAFAVFFPNGR